MHNEQSMDDDLINTKLSFGNIRLCVCVYVCFKMCLITLRSQENVTNTTISLERHLFSTYLSWMYMAGFCVEKSDEYNPLDITNSLSPIQTRSRIQTESLWMLSPWLFLSILQSTGEEASVLKPRSEHTFLVTWCQNLPRWLLRSVSTCGPSQAILWIPEISLDISMWSRTSCTYKMMKTILPQCMGNILEALVWLVKRFPLDPAKLFRNLIKNGFDAVYPRETKSWG